MSQVLAPLATGFSLQGTLISDPKKWDKGLPSCLSVGISSRRPQVGPGRLCQHNYRLSIFKYFGENYAGIIGTFSHLNGNNRQRTVLRLIISGYVMGKVQFHFSVAYSAPVECENNTGITGNLKRIIGSFWRLKE